MSTRTTARGAAGEDPGDDRGDVGVGDDRVEIPPSAGAPSSARIHEDAPGPLDHGLADGRALDGAPAIGGDDGAERDEAPPGPGADPAPGADADAGAPAATPGAGRVEVAPDASGPGSPDASTGAPEPGAPAGPSTAPSAALAQSDPAPESAPPVPAVPAPSAVAATPVGAPAPLDARPDEVARAGAGDAVPTTAGAGGSGGPGRTTGGARRGGRPKKDPEGRMALREHLVELRKRVVRAGIAVLLGAIAGWFLYDPVLEYMTAPLEELAADRTDLVQINFNNVASSFDLKLKGAIWIGVIVSSPLWIYQLWAFITPGLTKKERRYAVGFVAAAVPLFLGGVYLASLFIPRAVTFFTSFTPDGGSNIIDAPVYIGFVMRTVLTFGLAFLLPVVLVALNFAGLLSGRAVLKAWRWVLVASLTFAAIATPTPDITAMFTLAAPIIVLFALAIVVCLVNDRRRARRSPSAGLDDDEASPLSDDEASPL